jgi:hypothetical protein
MSRRLLLSIFPGICLFAAGCSEPPGNEESTYKPPTQQNEESAYIPPAADWVINAPDSPNNCPMSAATATSTNPYFEFNTTAAYPTAAQGSPGFSCHEDGPHDWVRTSTVTDPNKWYVQNIKYLRSTNCQDSDQCLISLIRVCTTTPADQFTPAGSAEGTKGCGVYLKSVKYDPYR